MPLLDDVIAIILVVHNVFSPSQSHDHNRKTKNIILIYDLRLIPSLVMNDCVIEYSYSCAN